MKSQSLIICLLPTIVPSVRLPGSCFSQTGLPTAFLLAYAELASKASLLCEHKLFSNPELSDVFPNGEMHTASDVNCISYPWVPKYSRRLFQILLIHVLSPFPISTCLVSIMHFDIIFCFHTGTEERVKVLAGPDLLLPVFPLAL